MRLDELETPSLLIDEGRLEKNLRDMQYRCTETGTELWPHVKTHKLVPVLKRQLALGATGATCAKLGEAEAMLPSGIKRIFLAHSLVDERKAPRIRKLADQLDELVLAVTSAAQGEILAHILRRIGLKLPVLMAVDTGLGREGARTVEDAVALAKQIRASKEMEFRGLYTHEGHAYASSSPDEAAVAADLVHQMLQSYASAIGGDVPLWPGCSVTAAFMAGKPGGRAVRPGSYVFGDLSLCETTRIRGWHDAAVTILTTVVDKPAKGLALIDAGTKVFSSDRSRAGIAGREASLPSIVVAKMNEEHGYLAGDGVDELHIGQRLRFVPAHVCVVFNLFSQAHLVRDETVLATWSIDARGRSD